MQVIAALVRDDDEAERLDELEEEVPRVLAHLEHLHQVQVFVVHLVLHVDAQDGLHHVVAELRRV